MQALAEPTTTPAPPVKALIDRFGRVHTYLRISVTERCNLRCRYCMPPEGVALKPRDAILSYEEILRVARVFAQLGINKVRITGGEPLVRKGLVDFIAELHAIPGIDTLAMTTNGVLLAEHAAGLRQAGLTHLNLSLDTLRPERFETITLRRDMAAVLRGLEAALELGFPSIKLNMVVMRGVNDDELLDFVELAREHPLHVRFIEYMPFAGNAWSHDKLFTYAEMRAAIAKRHALRRNPHDHGPSNTAREYVIDGYAGTLGFITSMTNDFCGTCNRVRLTADGHIKSCLFHHGELGLRDVLRGGGNDRQLEALIRQAIAEKPEGHVPLEQLGAAPNRSMITIGG